MEKIVNISKSEEFHVLRLPNHRGTMELDFSAIRKGMLSLLILAMESDSFNDYKEEVGRSIDDIKSILFFIEEECKE